MSNFVVSISYGNSLIQNGGTDKVIREHLELFTSINIDYFSLFPVVKTIKIGSIKKTYKYWGVNLNNKFIGIYNISDILDYIERTIADNNICSGIFIHHTWRVDSNDLILILKEINAPIYYYLHDFHSLCDNNTFVNDSNIYCGYGFDNNVCNTKCKFNRNSIINRHHFYNILKEFKNRIICIAPSDNTKDIFIKSFIEFKDLFITIPHQKFTGKYNRINKNSKLRIAYIGKRTHLKGWNDFINLIDNCDIENNYDLYYLGTDFEKIRNIYNVYVSVRNQGQDAMLKALRDNNIDIVLLLSQCPETYSYTFFEAYAAGCFVITYNCSGNMSDMVKKLNNGIVVDKFSDLVSVINNVSTITSLVSNLHSREKGFPYELIPNDRILSIMNISLNSTFTKGNYKFPKPKHIPTLIYKLQNRRKLNEIS